MDEPILASMRRTVTIAGEKIFDETTVNTEHPVIERIAVGFRLADEAGLQIPIDVVLEFDPPVRVLTPAEVEELVEGE